VWQSSTRLKYLKLKLFESIKHWEKDGKKIKTVGKRPNLHPSTNGHPRYNPSSDSRSPISLKETAKKRGDFRV